MTENKVPQKLTDAEFKGIQNAMNEEIDVTDTDVASMVEGVSRALDERDTVNTVNDPTHVAERYLPARNKHKANATAKVIEKCKAAGFSTKEIITAILAGKNPIKEKISKEINIKKKAAKKKKDKLAKKSRLANRR